MILLKGTENVDNYTMISILSKHTRIGAFSYARACHVMVSKKRTFAGRWFLTGTPDIYLSFVGGW